MRIGKYNRVILEDNEIDFIRKNYKNMPHWQMAEHLGLKLTTFRYNFYRLGLLRQEQQSWTAEQTEFLIENYKTIGDTELAKIFATRWDKKKGWSKKHIEKKRRQLKLKRTAKECKAIHQRNKDNGVFKDCANKMWASVGVTPVGEVKVWYFGTTKTPTAMIKTKKGFKAYNRWLFKKTYGKVPAGKLVVNSKDEIITTNPAHLELITRKELAARNKIKSVSPVIRKNRKLIKQIIQELKNHSL